VDHSAEIASAQGVAAAQARLNVGLAGLANKMGSNGPNRRPSISANDLDAAQKAQDNEKYAAEREHFIQFNSNLSLCLKRIHDSSPQTYDVIRSHFLTYIHQENAAGGRECFDTTDEPCSNLAFNGNIYAEIMSTENFLRMLSSDDNHGELTVALQRTVGNVRAIL
jgi:hypothetical protein